MTNSVLQKHCVLKTRSRGVCLQGKTSTSIGAVVSSGGPLHGRMGELTSPKVTEEEANGRKQMDVSFQMHLSARQCWTARIPGGGSQCCVAENRLAQQR